MKFSCPKTKLLNAINIVSKAVSTKTNLPILECILMDATNNQITLTANDTELGIETIIDGNVSENGIIALNAKLFSEIVKKLPDNEVYIETDSNYKTQIRCEKAKFSIMGFASDDFSYLPNIEKNTSIRISQFSLKEIIRQTIFSISDNENSKLMMGELFKVQNNKLKVSSLDGHRISIRNIDLDGENDEVTAIVPGKTLNDISKILSGEVDEMVSIYFTDKHVLFEMEKTKIVSRLLEGEFFNVDRMLSSDYETKIIINKKELYNCIDRSTLLIKDSDKRPIVIQVTDNLMQLQMDSAMGSMDEEIQIQKEGKDMLIGFNPRFLMDALRVIDDEEIGIYMVNSKAPCYIKDENLSYIYLILPVNFSAAGR